MLSRTLAFFGTLRTGLADRPWATVLATGGLLAALVLGGIRCTRPAGMAFEVSTGAGIERVAPGGEPAADLPPGPTPAPTLDGLTDLPLHGIALGLFSRDPNYSYRGLLREIRSTGAGWVSLVVDYYQEQVDSCELPLMDPRTPSGTRLRITIREAHQEGLKVMLFPILLLRSPGPDDWRGTLRPTDPDAWYRAYTALLVRLAIIAEQEGVAMLSVGSEFNSLQRDEERWRRLVRTIRQHYRGALTYSVNWDSLDGPSFLDELDVVGMTTYFSLADDSDPTVEEMVTRLLPVRDDIVEWQTHHGQPLIFTEVGFPALDGGCRDPWNYYVSDVVDVDEQRDGYEAFRRVFHGEPALAGLFFYNWFGAGGLRDGSYTPRGKPAEQVIRTWFGSGQDALEEQR